MPGAGSRGTSQERGRQRRVRLVEGATSVLLEGGLQAVSARSVADAAGVPLAAVTYYFTSLDELIAEAMTGLLHRWVEQVRHTTRSVRASGEAADLARLVTKAMLPPGGDNAVQAHYELLLACGRRTVLSAALARGRGHLDEALAELIEAAMPRATSRPSPQLVLAVVDGAVVSALSEGAAVDTTARARLSELLSS